MIWISKKFFGLSEDRNHKILQADIVSFLRNHARKVYFHQEEKYDAIFIDACSDSENSLVFCPIWNLTSTEEIKRIRNVLKNNGTITVNIVSETTGTAESVLMCTKASSNLSHSEWIAKLEVCLEKLRLEPVSLL
ncbi:hypothetical protein AB6A40_007866 [Gnathostoma spinigerum]|uniref:Uncharacterized protein n=1 Tax=Gnathostoma spinigerum TaxID=75299 RepID=A0ABD6EX56_9BILA